MSEKKNGGAAFPANPNNAHCEPGMSLRDYFAAKALPAIIAAYIEANGRCIGTDHFPGNTTAHAYRVADAMLAAREVKP